MGAGSAPIRASRSRISGVRSAAVIVSLSRATTAGGVPAGAKTPNQVDTSNPARPLSFIVGTSGIDGARCGVVTPVLSAFRP